MPAFQSLADLERLAAAALPAMVAGYYASGAEDETTLADNRAAWGRWRILPRVMVDVSAVDCRVELFGEMGTSREREGEGVKEKTTRRATRPPRLVSSRPPLSPIIQAAPSPRPSSSRPWP